MPAAVVSLSPGRAMRRELWVGALPPCYRRRGPGSMGVGAALLWRDHTRLVAPPSESLGGLPPGERSDLRRARLRALLAGDYRHAAGRLQDVGCRLALLASLSARSHPGYAAGLLSAKGDPLAGAGRTRGAVLGRADGSQPAVGGAPNDAAYPARAPTGLPALPLRAQTQGDCTFLPAGVARRAGDLPPAAQHPGASHEKSRPAPLAA